MSATDNMRLNQSRFKQTFAEAENLTQAIRRHENSLKRASFKQQNKP